MTQGSPLLSGDDGRNSASGGQNKMSVISGPRMRETIHSGHFMVSDFEPESEAQDEEYEVGMPIPPGPDDTVVVQAPPNSVPLPPVSASDSFNTPMMMMPMMMEPMMMEPMKSPELPVVAGPSYTRSAVPFLNTSISIDGSLTKLFQCMSLAYRQKLTSPKWNRFKGVRLRWKDKIRLNNVIWRCWHMQFILKQRTLVCQFASPLDVDQHNKPEVQAVVMEGKYWKRKLSTVAAEYKKWRLFYRNKMMGWTHKDPTPDLHPVSLDGFDWNRAAPFGGGPINSILFDDDLLMDFSDTLFSSLSSQPFAFPNPREIARAGIADFIQPGLVQLQPNLEDFMDTLEPLQDYVNSKLLPPVPEELENFDSPDGLLPVEVLPPLIQKTSSSTISKQQASEVGVAHQSVQSMGNGVVRIQPSNSSPGYSSSVQQQSNYFQMPEMNGPTRQTPEATIVQQQATPVSVVMSVPHHQPQQKQQSQQQLSPSTSNTSLLKDGNSHHRDPPGHQSSRGGYSSRHDIFAKPVGKPRGRSRSGTSGRSMLGSTPSPAVSSCHPPPPPNNMTHPNMHTNMAPSQMSNSMSNSTTLLSHLLTTSGNGAHFPGPIPMDKMGAAHGNNMVLSGNSSILQATNAGQNNMMGTMSMAQQDNMQQQHHQAHHHHHHPQQQAQQQQSQQQQAQPWNPKNANETINPNVPINFGLTKSMLQLSHNQQNINVGGLSGGAGNVSPPLLSNTPSPPMGPPLGGPASPSKPFRPKSDTDREHRRVCHINAEQKRRCNIKNGFDMLHSLIPQLSHNPNAKVSKAAMLQKGAEYIRQLKLERAQLKEEIEAHRQEVDALNSAINNCQSMLPATGAPVSRQRTNKMKEMFDQWVRCRTTENWKFWIFSILIRPLLDSYNNSVSTASVDEMCRTVLAWVDQHCSLVDLRPAVLNSLRYLCTTTDILTNPSNLPEEAYKAVNRAPRDNSEREPR